MGLFRGLRRGATFASLGLAGGALVVTARHILETPQPLESALPAEARIDRKHGGDVYYNIAGPEDAQPLVLLHDFYPGASNFEFRHVFGPLARRYRVYAPDWLGFGMSEHPHVAYTGEFYAGLLTGFLRDVVAQPAVVVAHGRAANIAVRAASDAPELFERLVLVAPAVRADRKGDATLGQALVRATQRFMLGLVPYALLSTRPALRWMTMARSARAPDGRASDETLDHLYASAHQFGGHHAMLALLTGELDLPMRNAFALLEPPVLIVAGRRDRQHPRADMEDLAVLNPHADLRPVPGAADAIFEDQPEGFVAALTEWLQTPVSRHTLDESALLPADEAESRVEGGIEHVGADAELPPTPTEGNVPPHSVGTTGATEATEATEDIVTGDAIVGEPGAVVPGVSDMGLEGPSTPDVGGIATLEEPGITLGPPDTEGTERAPEGSSPDSPDELLPEAGSTGSSGAAEQEARAGEDPPLAPASNIGQEPEPASGTENAGSVGAGDVAGLAQIVQTPNDRVATSTNAVQTAADSVAATDKAVRTSRQTVDTPEMLEENTSPGGDQDVTSRASSQTQHATRAKPHEPGARTAPASASGSTGTTSAAGTSTGKSGKSGKSGTTGTSAAKRGKAGGKPSGTKGRTAGGQRSRKRSSLKSSS